MKLSRYKFRQGDLIVTSQSHELPNYRGILMDRFKQYGTWTWRIHWFKGPRGICTETECETNLFNLRRRYHYYNNKGEYYESTN